MIWTLLGSMACTCGAAMETARGTHAIGEVSDQVADLYIPVLELAIQPAGG
jgi:hypothetical protein